MNYTDLIIGVLALQGDFERHEHQIRLLGATPLEVRLAEHFDQIDALIIPGGESTTMDRLLDRFALRGPLLEFAKRLPIWGTCAGMIMVACGIDDNQSGVKPLALIDIDVVRMGYGRQVFSFEEPLEASLNGSREMLKASFIRAPRITRLGDGVEVLANYDDVPVLVSQGRILVSSFHTELDDDTRLLRYFVDRYVLSKERS